MEYYPYTFPNGEDEWRTVPLLLHNNKACVNARYDVPMMDVVTHQAVKCELLLLYPGLNKSMPCTDARAALQVNYASSKATGHALAAEPRGRTLDLQEVGRQ